MPNAESRKCSSQNAKTKTIAQPISIPYVWESDHKQTYYVCVCATLLVNHFRANGIGIGIGIRISCLQTASSLEWYVYILYLMIIIITENVWIYVCVCGA